jgi:hypothetical protein
MHFISRWNDRKAVELSACSLFFAFRRIRHDAGEGRRYDETIEIQPSRENNMKIARHMEAIFIATLLILGGINMATTLATSVLPELPFAVAAANL